MKSTPEQIRQRFDRDVERFSNLETGQSATLDAPLVLDLITEAAEATTPGARALLDVGCGAGNYSIKMLQRRPGLDVTLVDLSRPMLDRAIERVTAAGARSVAAHQADIRNLRLPDASVDLILAAAVLHHLRGPEEWEAVFRAFHRWLRPGGSIWIADLVEQSIPAIQSITWKRYGRYLADLKGETYRDDVLAYIDAEDTPRPLLFQTDLLRAVGFAGVDVLHKNVCFAAIGAVK